MMESIERIRANDQTSATVQRGAEVKEEMFLTGYFTFECYDKDGRLKWKETMKNQVTTVGANFMLDTMFTGSGYTAAWYMGLVTGPGSGTTYSAGDTMASHAGWAEDTTYSNATRPAVTFASASSASISTSAASVFNINGTATIAGGFVVNNDTKGGASGTLYSAKDFTGGDRNVVNGDTLNVSYTTTITV